MLVIPRWPVSDEPPRPGGVLEVPARFGATRLGREPMYLGSVAEVNLDSADDLAFEQWCRAVRWRRAVRASLTKASLTFSQWLVLKATSNLVRASGDAVNQGAVARRVGFDPGTTSRVMWGLAYRGLVDIGPDMERHEDRIYVTESGLAALRATAKYVEAASMAVLRSGG